MDRRLCHYSHTIRSFLLIAEPFKQKLFLSYEIGAFVSAQIRKIIMSVYSARRKKEARNDLKKNNVYKHFYSEFLLKYSYETHCICLVYCTTTFSVIKYPKATKSIFIEYIWSCIRCNYPTHG